MFKVYVWDGRYIQGKEVGEADTESEAWKIAKAALAEAEFEGPFKKERERRKSELVIWLDDKHGNPVGIIIGE